MIQFYAAGPYSAPDPQAILENINTSLAVAVHIASKTGWFPIVPHSSGSHCRTWEEAMNDCRATLRAMRPGIDVLVMLPGWRDSPGAVEERDLALSLGLKVLTCADVLNTSFVAPV